MALRASKLILTLGVPAFTIGTDFTGSLMLVTPIEREYGVDITTTQWVLNIYALTFAMCLVSAGRLGDMFGRTRMLVVGLSCFVVASLGCTLAPSIGWLIAARAVQGAGSAMIWPNLLGLAATSVGKQEQAKAIGLVLGCTTAGNVIGPIFSGVVGGLGHWRIFFLANVVLGLISAIVMFVHRDGQRTRRNGERVDFGGMAVLSLSILALLYALDVGADWGWGSKRLIALFMGSGVLLLCFRGVEKLVREPMVPSSMFRNVQFLMALSLNGLALPAAFVGFLYCPQYLNKVMGWSIVMASIGSLPLMISTSITTFVTGKLYGGVGPRSLLIVGYAIVVLGAGGMVLLPLAWGYAGLVGVMLLIGAGAGVAVAAAGSAAVAMAERSQAGLSSGLSFMVHLVLGSVGVGATTAIVWAVSSVRFSEGLTALGLHMSAGDQQTLNASALGGPDTQHILSAYSADMTHKITALIGDSFAIGFHRAFLMPLIAAVLGLVVCFFLDSRKLKQDIGSEMIEEEEAIMP